MTTEIPASVLALANRAPSAHNAQPWRLWQEDGHHQLGFSFADHLDADPDDRDAYLSVGAFFESLRMAAEGEGLRAEFVPNLQELQQGLAFGRVECRPLAHGDERDPLAASLPTRLTNRDFYEPRTLDPEVRSALEALGLLFLDPEVVAPLVKRASVLAWRDARFVTDLKEWTRFDDLAPDGMTCECLNLSRVDRAALRYALWRGRLGPWLAGVFAQRDVRLTLASSTVAVLPTPSMEPLDLFEQGRKLLRAWVTITGAGWAYHPISIVIDQEPTRAELATILGIDTPGAIFRVGYTTRSAPRSHRRPRFDALQADQRR